MLKCLSEASPVTTFVLSFAIKDYHFCWMKCGSFCTGSRSMCVRVFLTNLTKKQSFVKKNHFLRDFCIISYPNIDFQILKEAAITHYLDCTKEP